MTIYEFSESMGMRVRLSAEKEWRDGGIHVEWVAQIQSVLLLHNCTTIDWINHRNREIPYQYGIGKSPEIAVDELCRKLSVFHGEKIFVTNPDREFTIPENLTIGK